MFSGLEVKGGMGKANQSSQVNNTSPQKQSKAVSIGGEKKKNKRQVDRKSTAEMGKV